MSLAPAGPAAVGLADTSLFIAQEQQRPIAGRPPERISLSVITIAELRLGVLAADDPAVRARRLETLLRADALEPLPVDGAVAAAWAALVAALRAERRRMPLNDSWIAATAIAHDMPVVTQDADYDGVPGLAVLRV